MMIAAKNGQNLAVATFLENGSNDNAIIHSRNECGRTTLMTAAQNDYQPLIKTLLEDGTHIESKNEWGATGLMLASKKRCGSMVATLIKKEAELKKQR